jgi:hypothetical protein
MEIHMRASRIAAALSIVGSLTVAAHEPAHAAPVTPLSAVAAVHDNGAVQVRFGGWGGGWHGGGWGGGWGPRGWGWGAGALAAGALVGAAAAAPYYGGGYYPYYDNPAPYYGNGYGYGGYGYGGYDAGYVYVRPYPRVYYYQPYPYYGW